MTNQSNQTPQLDMAVDVFNRFSPAMMAALPPSFHAAPNAKYPAEEVVRFPIMMCAKKASHRGISVICRDKTDPKKIPSDATLLNRIGGSSYSVTRDSCDKMLDLTLAEPRSLGLFRRPVITASDEHDVPVHFDKFIEEYMAKGKPKSGTSKMIRYTTTKIVGRAAGFTVAAHPTGKKHAKEDIVYMQIRHMREMGIKSKRHLFDKGFYKAAVIKALEKARQSFIMPARWSKRMDKIVARYDQKEIPAVMRHTVNSGGESAEVTLVIVKRKGSKKNDPLRDRYLVFITDADVHNARSILANIPKIYKKRWGIETGYRCAKQCRPFTCSKNPSVRLVHFYFTMIIYNIWVMVNWHARRKTPGRSDARPVIEMYRMMEKFWGLCLAVILRGVTTDLFFMEEIG